jgi:hypothetical protein
VGRGRWIAAAAGAAALVFGTSAGAGIKPTTSPAIVASAIVATPGLVKGAAFDSKPPGGATAAVASTPLALFPRFGPTYAILSTGDAAVAGAPNNAANTGVEAGGDPVRGDTDFDVTILRIDLQVPQGANCLSVDFRFLSEEYPEFVGQEFNDAFIAELDTSDWTTHGSAIVASHNFAFDSRHRPISVNSTGPASVSPANAAGTTYDAATGLLTASTPVTPGPHKVYFSIFDQGDDLFDSAVFLDRLAVGTSISGACAKGVTEGGGVAGDTPPRVTAGDVTGDTFITIKGSKTRLLPGANVPTGSIVDTSAPGASVELFGPNGRDVFSQGAFTVRSTTELVRSTSSRAAAPTRIPVVELRLTGGDFGVCKTRSPSSVGATKPPPKRNKTIVRRLFGKGKGHFRTRGSFAAATVRGTVWLMEDRCDGTWLHVTAGLVEVRDFVKQKTVLVHPGKTYLALKPS